MVRALRWLGVGVLAFGLLIAADAIERGDASAYLVLIVPVVTGGSLEFFAAIALIVLGLGLLLSGSGDWEPEEDEGPSPPPTRAAGSGGVILLGPLPIFFGNWKATGPRARWAWSAAGAALLVALVVLYGFGFAGW